MNAYDKKCNNLQNVFGKPQLEIILFKKKYESVFNKTTDFFMTF